MINLRSFYFLCVVVVALAFIDCIWIGYKIWTTPIRYEVVEGRNAGPNDVGTTNLHYEYRPFQAVSTYGVAPLLLPILISAIALWSACLMRPVILLIIACIFILFIFITGFSIGSSYMRAGLGLILAAILGLTARKQSGLKGRPLD